MHASAFGISIQADKFDQFVEITDELLKDFNFTPCYRVDLEVTAEELTDQEVFAIGSNADLWGRQSLMALKHLCQFTTGVLYYYKANEEA